MITLTSGVGVGDDESPQAAATALPARLGACTAREPEGPSVNLRVGMLKILTIPCEVIG
jgi:hypothetical protein